MNTTPNLGSWTIDENVRICELWRAGKNDVEIAEELFYSPQTIRMRRKKLGLPSHGRYKPKPRFDWNKIGEMLKAGKSTNQISREIGCCDEVVLRVKRQLGMIPDRAEERRRNCEIVAMLHAQGMTDPEISNASGICRETVGKVRRILGLKSNYNCHARRNWGGRKKKNDVCV